MSAQSPDENVGYAARKNYLAEDVVQNYMRNRFSGVLGRYRYRREQRAVNSLIAQIPKSEVQDILDCPTGLGRWLPNLAVLQPDRIVAVDASPTMLKKARTVSVGGIRIEFQEGIAEQLPFEDRTFDLAFCHALLKHLPESAKLEVIRELARVTSRYVIVTASVRRGLPGFIRQFRSANGGVAVSQQWIQRSVKNASLRIIDARKATTPIGVEYSYLLEKI
ncbi:class I SAM-dependent methyltransferase [Mycolicibacterium elephantis]|uniref:class I SAM-dependent methyltransferase n=1 Tax=Mycolicibacterium elephantis TaxID=81858 RepID=UPI0013E389D2|nr:class I SAM-dependent methyltransferase [Mycolicibacterium elephantis]MCV7220894.1 class I SAM-dependent methyltransferase [Mycolicibacterium elephantis]